MPYPLYEKNRPCPLCRETGASTRCKRISYAGRSTHQYEMVRTCPNCGHVWCEQPLDSEEKGE